MIKTKDTSNQTDKLVERAKQININGLVCDLLLPCAKWRKEIWRLQDLEIYFRFCPFCGAEINWNWPRLNEPEKCLSCGCADEPGHVCQAERSG